MVVLLLSLEHGDKITNRHINHSGVQTNSLLASTMMRRPYASCPSPQVSIWFSTDVL